MVTICKLVCKRFGHEIFRLYFQGKSLFFSLLCAKTRVIEGFFSSTLALPFRMLNIFSLNTYERTCENVKYFAETKGVCNTSFTFLFYMYTCVFYMYTCIFSLKLSNFQCFSYNQKRKYNRETIVPTSLTLVCR